MEIQTGALIIVLAYMVGMMIIGYVVGKINIKGSADYLVAGRRMGLFMVAFSLSANNIGGGSTTGLAQKAFGAWGISAIWYVLAASLAMIPLAYFAPKIRKTMAVTIPEVVGRRFGKLSSNFTAVLSVLSLFCLTSSQIGASGAVINALIPSIPLNVCLLLAGSGASGDLLGAYLAILVPGKLSPPWYLLLLRGVLCNFLVCIAVFAGFRLKSETAKAIVVFLVVTTFVLTGLEHSIANMAYFSLYTLLVPGADIAAMGWNLLWVTLGNLLGGAVLLGLPLWYAAEPEKSAL